MKTMTVTLEVETNCPISILRSAKEWNSWNGAESLTTFGSESKWFKIRVVQAQANVADQTKPKVKRPKKGRA